MSVGGKLTTLLVLRCALAVVFERDGKLQAFKMPPVGYEGWSAEAKRSWFEDFLGHGSPPAAFDEPVKACYNTECVQINGSLSRADIVKPLECRMFNNHMVGVLAWVEAEWEANAYTGLFQRAEHGLMRISWNHITSSFMSWFGASKVDKGTLGETAISGETIGLSLKFLRSGAPSGNFKAVHATQYRDRSWNIFEYPFSNQNPSLDVPLNKTDFDELGEWKKTEWPGFIGLSDLARYTQEGDRVADPDISFPYQIILIPVMSPAWAVGANGPDLTAITRGQIPPKTTIFDIYAKDSMTAAAQRIGSLRTTSPLMTSGEADRQLRFYHQVFEEDLALRPELKTCKDYWNCPVCPYTLEACGKLGYRTDSMRRMLEGTTYNATSVGRSGIQPLARSSSHERSRCFSHTCTDSLSQKQCPAVAGYRSRGGCPFLQAQPSDATDQLNTDGPDPWCHADLSTPEVAPAIKDLLGV